MSFIRYLSKDELPDSDRVPDADNILQIHGVHPAIMHHHYALYRELMYGASPLSRWQRELLGVRVSALNGCRY